jgi:hypothetical protein
MNPSCYALLLNAIHIILRSSGRGQLEAAVVLSLVAGACNKLNKRGLTEKDETVENVVFKIKKEKSGNENYARNRAQEWRGGASEPTPVS